MKEKIKAWSRGNRGFSMVEIIIIIAIMAILTAALSPLLIKYIKKSRRTRDIDTAAEIQKAFDRVAVEMSDDHLMPDGTYGTGTLTVRYDTSLNNPPKYIEDRAFAELGGVPKSAAFKDYYWEIEYTTYSGHVTGIWLVPSSGSSERHELIPDCSAFEEGK